MRRQQLARARAAALDVPLEREALLDQVVDVVAQDELVDGVVLEGAADEEDAAAPDQRPDREEVHVDAAGGVVGRMAVLVQDVLQRRGGRGSTCARAGTPPGGAARARRLLERALVVVAQRLARSRGCRAGG